MRVLEALDVAAAQQSPTEAAAAARAAAGARADTERPLRLAARVLLLYLQVRRTVQRWCNVGSCTLSNVRGGAVQVAGACIKGLCPPRQPACAAVDVGTNWSLVPLVPPACSWCCACRRCQHAQSLSPLLCWPLVAAFPDTSCLQRRAFQHSSCTGSRRPDSPLHTTSQHSSLDGARRAASQAGQLLPALLGAHLRAGTGAGGDRAQVRVQGFRTV
jgi:hypothetical protein